MRLPRVSLAHRRTARITVGAHPPRKLILLACAIHLHAADP
jgi:hypothetical protein